MPSPRVVKAAHAAGERSATDVACFAGDLFRRVPTLGASAGSPFGGGGRTGGDELARPVGLGQDHFGHAGSSDIHESFKSLAAVSSITMLS